MKIALGCDHGGLNLKEEIAKYLEAENIEFKDFGTYTEESCDYADIALPVAEAVVAKEFDFGILICGTGIGMSIACNKVKKVRCAKVTTKEEAFLARSHNNANVIALSENTNNYKEIIDTFLTTDFSNEEKHRRRVEMIDNYDN